MCSVLVYIDVCSDLVRGDASSILLPTMRSEIFGSLSSLDFVTEDVLRLLPQLRKLIQ